MGFDRIEDIEVWQRGCRLAVDVYSMSKAGLLSKDYGLRDQIRRAAVSISSNIAEGYERESDKEFARFLYIAKGSCGELRTQLYIAKALNYISNTDSDKLILECKEISSMLAGLIKYLRGNK
jgi:four helix bundle protein